MNQTCKVCGEAAAGFHFGAFTCEGCKSFFGRTYNNLSSISECKNGGQCVINKKNRTSCKACRLRKCLVVGMSKSGSRYGRRSNWFKIHCLLQEQANNNNNNNNNSSSVSPNNSLNPSVIQNAVFNGMYQGALQGLLPSPDKLARFNAAALAVASAAANASECNRKRPAEGSTEELRCTPDSAASSLDEESSSTSFLRPHDMSSSASQTPSPFSEKEFLHFTQHHHHQQQQQQRKIPTSLPASPVGSFSSLSPGSNIFMQQRLMFPFSAGYSNITTGLSPKSSPLNDHLRLYGGRSVDFLAVPALGGVAEDQAEPMDLSVKSKSMLEDKTDVEEGYKSEDEENEPEEVKKFRVPSPLDLTKQEIPA